MARILDDAGGSAVRMAAAGEIDILEWTGHDPHRIIGAIHCGDLPPDNVYYSETLRAPADIKPWPWVFDEKPFYLIVNMAVGGTLGGEVVPDDLPATVEFDWIHVYP